MEVAVSADVQLQVISKRNLPHLLAHLDNKEVAHPIRGKDQDKALWNAIARAGNDLFLSSSDVQRLYKYNVSRLKKEMNGDDTRIVIMDVNEAIEEFNRRRALGGKMSEVLKAMYALDSGRALVVEGMTASDITLLRGQTKRFVSGEWKFSQRSTDEDGRFDLLIYQA